MLPILVAALLAVAWAPTTRFNGICTALPRWVAASARFPLRPHVLTALWFLWHAHASYALARDAELTTDALGRALFTWCALKFWASCFFGSSVVLLAYALSGLWLLAAALVQGFVSVDTLDTLSAGTLACFALWNLDTFLRVLNEVRLRLERPPSTKKKPLPKARQFANGKKRFQAARSLKR